MLIALINDTHHDCRGGNAAIAAHQAKFWSEVFWPYLDRHNIRSIIHLGDLVDDRKHIDLRSLMALQTDLFTPAERRGVEFDVILGNHDVYFKSTNERNIMDSAFANTAYTRSGKLRWFSRPQEVTRGGLSMLFVPWVCKDTDAATIAAVDNSKSLIAMGHFEFNGFDMYRGTPAHGGYSAQQYSKFEAVFSGHYHHKSTRNNIHYLGAQYEMTWADYGDDRGFHVFDTETRELTYVKNPLGLFHKLFYDDANFDDFDKLYADVVKGREDVLADGYVKLVLIAKNNAYFLDRLAERLERIGLANLQIVDDHKNLDAQPDDELINEAESTITIIRKFALQLAESNPQIESDRLSSLLADLFREASAIDGSGD
ncbi:MAG: hypothetical protein DDT26_00426 [Dehalococcoidia bacterium]|nr:hypothetical protein [Chloroflexota bacterium]